MVFAFIFSVGLFMTAVGTDIINAGGKMVEEKGDKPLRAAM